MLRGIRRGGGGAQPTSHFVEGMRKRLVLHASACCYYFVLHQTRKSLAGLGQGVADLIFERCHQLGCRGRCGRSPVGDKIRDRKIRFVAHRRDHGNCGAADRPGHFFSVKGPEVFSRTTTATNY